MGIPAFYEFFSFILKILENSEPIHLKEIRDELVQILELSEEDLQELLPSGRETVFSNRTNWAAYYLKRAGYLYTPKRGVYGITDKGKTWIYKNGYEISIDDLNKSEDFTNFRTPKNAHNSEIKSIKDDSEQTPETKIDLSFNQLNQQLSDELLEEIMSMTPHFFERLVLDLLYSLGYGGKRENVIITTSYSQDEGIDGLIKEDELGLDHVYVQAKRWQNTVGHPEVQQFSGALSGQGAHKGVFITTSSFSKQAVDFVKKQLNNRIVLVDGQRLTELMISYGVGLTTEKEYKIQKIDRDYFSIED